MTAPCVRGWTVPARVTSLIDGRQVAPRAAGHDLPVMNSFDESEISCLREADADEVAGALQTARAAFDHGPWPRMDAGARKEILGAIRDRVLAHADELALASMRIATCITFGNTCMLKPSEYTPLSVTPMVELCHEAGLPPGIVNDSPFGLVCYLWSRQLDDVMRVSCEVRAGTIWVNTPMMSELRAPFGGYKQSGVGRDGATSSAGFFTELKTTTIPVDAPALPHLGAAG